MFKKLLAISFIFLSKYGIANNDTDIIDADKFFNSGNFTKLEQLHSNNKYNLIVNYLNAKAQLIINNPYAAEVFIQSMPNSFMRNDLIHQLLIFYFKYERYNEYKNTYYRLAFPQASTNETCGLDISNIMLKTTISPISNINYLVKNNITPWCTNLLVLIAKQNKITDTNYEMRSYFQNKSLDPKTKNTEHYKNLYQKMGEMNLALEQVKLETNVPVLSQKIDKIEKELVPLKVQTPYTLLMMRVVEIGIPALLSLFSIIFLLKYTLTEKRSMEIKELLKQRNN